MQWIPLTKANYTSLEETEVLTAIRTGHLEGDGPYTKKIHQFFTDRYQCKKALMTTSGTDALELAALLLDLKPDDEVIVPSYTFVSSAHAFALRGAKIIFADSEPNHPNISIDSIKKLITKKTKAVVPVHYAGFACDMEALMKLSEEHGFFVVADAAQAIESKYQNKSIAQWGHLVAYSFHQTKNVSSGEGGILLINDDRFVKRAEIIREKGTNRSAFFRGEVDKYTCVDIGSSFLASDLNASLLWGQLQRLDEIQKARMNIWNHYHQSFQKIKETAKEQVQLPVLLKNCEHNAHCYFLICKNLEQRTKLIGHLKALNIAAPFHYISLHKSPFYQEQFKKLNMTEPLLPQADHFTDNLVRLPLFPTMTESEIQHVTNSVLSFFGN
jgi:dTDP-4-amino-4,6-dideoxygalactose transaminase